VVANDKILRKLLFMKELIKVSSLNTISVVVKMLTLLGINKVLAIYIGPTGYAAIGQFQNAVQMVSAIGSNSISTGVTKYTAQYSNDDKKLIALWKTSGSIVLITSLIVSLVLFFFRFKFAEIFLKDESYSSLFIFFSITIFFIGFNSLFLSVLNGRKEILDLVKSNILGSCFMFLASVLLLSFLGLYGALLSLVVYQFFTFFATFYFVSKKKWFHLKNFYGEIDKRLLYDLGKYAFIAFVIAVMVPVSQIFIRNYLVSYFDWNYAGYWEAVMRLSSSYLLVFTSAMSVYYLPKFTNQGNKELSHEVWSGFHFLIPVVSGLLVFIYVLRKEIVDVLFSTQFSVIQDYFGWQLIGDFFKVGGWFLSYVLIAKANHFYYLISVILFPVLFYFLIIIFSSVYGFNGVFIAYAVNQLLFFLFMISVFVFVYMV